MLLVLTTVEYTVKPMLNGYFQNDRKLPGFQSKKEGRYQESIQSSTKAEPGYQLENDNFIIRHHKREPTGQPFPSR